MSTRNDMGYVSMVCLVVFAFAGGVAIGAKVHPPPAVVAKPDPGVADAMILAELVQARVVEIERTLAVWSSLLDSCETKCSVTHRFTMYSEQTRQYVGPTR
jgi:hypothetical protein